MWELFLLCHLLKTPLLLCLEQLGCKMRMPSLFYLPHWVTGGDPVEERMGKDTVKHVHKRMCCRIPCIWSSGAHASVQNTLFSFLPPDLSLSMSPFLLLLFANTSFSFRNSLQIYFLQEVFPHPHGLENFAWFQLCLKQLSVKVTNTQVSGR